MIIRITDRNGGSRQVEVKPGEKVTISEGDQVEFVDVAQQSASIQPSGENLVVNVDGWGVITLEYFQAYQAGALPPMLSFSTGMAASVAESGPDSQDNASNGEDNAASEDAGEDAAWNPEGGTAQDGTDGDGGDGETGSDGLTDTAGNSAGPGASSNSGNDGSGDLGGDADTAGDGTDGESGTEAPGEIAGDGANGETGSGSDPAASGDPAGGGADSGAGSPASGVSGINRGSGAPEDPTDGTMHGPAVNDAPAFGVPSDSVGAGLSTGGGDALGGGVPSGEATDPGTDPQAGGVPGSDADGKADGPGAEVTEGEIASVVFGNSGPETGDTAIEVIEDTPFTGKIDSSDPDQDPLTHTLDTAPAHGRVEIDPGGSFTYTPDENYHGSDQFTVQVVDPGGLEETASVSINVAAAADAPALDVANSSGGEDTVIALDIAAALADTDGSESLAITIAGVPAGARLSAGIDNGNGTWSLAPNQTAGLTLTPPANGNTDIALTVTATATEENGNTAATVRTLAVALTGDADTPALTVADASGAEDTAIALDIAPALADADGSESLTVTIAGMPAGAALSAGIDNGDGTWSLTAAQTAGLTLTPPANGNTDFTLTITATATEDDGDSAATVQTITVALTGDADTPALTIADAAGTEDTAIALNIAAALTDTDGSESLAVTVAGIPDGASLSAGIDNGNGTWSLTPAQLAGLTITPPANSNVDFTLTVTATSTESDGDTAATVRTLDVSITGDADAPVVTVSDVVGTENTAIALDIAATLTDTDGSESLPVTISGIPDGASLSAGTDNHDGTWTLTPAETTGLTFTPAADFTGNVILTVTATATENDGDTATVSRSLDITVNRIPQIDADKSISLPDDAGTFALDIAAPSDSPDDTLSVRILSLPENGTIRLADGTVVAAPGAIALDALTGLTFTPTNGDADATSGLVYRVSDQHGASREGTVTLSVRDESASGDTLDFYNVASIGNYDGFNWSGFTHYSSSSLSAEGPAGMAYIPSGGGAGVATRTDGAAFNLVSLDLRGYNTGHTATIEGYRDGTRIVSQAVDMTTSYQRVTLNWENIDEIRFVTTQAGDYIFLDNFAYSQGSGDETAASAAGTAGDEIFVITGSDIAAIHAGTGTDTLALAGSGAELDLTRVADDAVTGIERIDITGTGNNTLKLTAADAKALSEATDTLVVGGNTGDTVTLVGPWSADGTGTVDGIVHDRYVLDGATVFLAQDVTMVRLIEGTDGNDTLSGTAAADTLSGGAGDDILTGGGGDDRIEGGEGSDTADYAGATAGVTVDLSAGTAAGNASVGSDTLTGIENVTGSGHDDTLTGNAGANVLSGGAGNDALSGGEGSDTADYSGATAGVTVDLSAGTAAGDASVGSDTLTGIENVTGSGHDDTLTGDAGGNVLSGGAGNDILTGGAGADTLSGGAGNDTLVWDGQDVRIDGGTGIDTLTVAGNNVTLDLTQVADEVITGIDRIDITGSGDNLLQLSASDVLALTDAGHSLTMVGNAGDRIRLMGQWEAGAVQTVDGVDHTPYTLAGATLLVPSAVTAEVRIEGAAEDDTLAGTAGPDIIDGGAGNDTLTGGRGDDTLVGGDGTDTADYASATAGVTVDLSAGTATGDDSVGSDTLSGIENAAGSGHDDILTGDGSVNTLSGNGGNDTLSGGAGADILSGGAGDDILIYDAADSRVDGGAGTDTLRIDGSGITVDLTQVADSVHTNIERIDLTGTGDNKLVFNNADIKAMTGDDNTVTVIGDSGDEVQLKGQWQKGDARTVDGVEYEVYTLDGATVLVDPDITPVVHITGTDAADTLTGSAARDILEGGAGPDVIDGRAGADTLSGGIGNDTLVYDAADTGIDGGGGEQDTLRIDGTGQHLDLTGAAGDAIAGIERIDITGTGNNTLTLGRQDALDLSDTSDVVAVIGDAGDTVNLAGIWTIAGTQPVDDVIYNKYTSGDATVLVNPNVTVNLNLEGTDGDDTITAAGGADVVDGLAGNDLLDGAAGADTLRGGDGNDTLVYDGDDVLADGGAGTDILRVDGHGQVVDLMETGDGIFTNIETIDLTGDGGNTLILAATDVTAINDGALLTVTGAAGDTVNLDGAWAAGADVVADGKTFHTYTLEGATLRVEDGVTVGSVVTGTAGDDNLTGTGGNDVIRGDAGNDTIDGGTAADVLRGGAGNDTLVFDAADTVIDGGADTDTVTADGNVDLTALSDDRLVNIEIFDITGTGDNQLTLSRTDVAAMTDGNNVLTVTGNSGDSLVLKGAWDTGGTETVEGIDYAVFEKDGVRVRVAPDVTASVALTGTAGKDTLTGGSAAETLTGEASNDTIDGGQGADALYGGAGDDVLVYDSADTVIDGGDGTDTLRLSGSGQVLDLDTLPGGQVTGIERIDLTGTGDNAVIVSTDAVGTTFGGRLIVQGNTGDSVTFRGDWTARGTEKVEGVTYDKYVSGENTVLVDLDVALGQVMIGTAESDGLTGGTGADIIDAKAGDDTIDGGRGVDDIDAGAGNDAIVFDAADIRIAGGTGTDTLRLSGANTIIDLPNVADNVLTGIDAVDLTGTGNNRLIVTAADVTALTDSNTLRVDGNDGDRLNLDGAWAEDGTETIGEATYTRYVLDGATVLVAAAVTVGTVFHDTAGADTLTGPSGNNVIRGEAGDDTIDGGAGDHVLDGGAGNDTLVYDAADSRFDGGAGSDILQVAGQGESIDLTADGGNRILGIETVDLTGSGANTFTVDENSVVAASDTDAMVIRADGDDTVNLEGGWTSLGTVESDGETYLRLALDDATVDVDTDAVVNVVNELGGVTTFGTDGDDSVTMTAAGAVVAGAGDDTVRLDNTNFTQIDGGDGYDVVNISNAGTTLDATLIPDESLSNIEEIDMSEYTYNTNRLVLTEEKVIAATDADNELVVTGNYRDTLELQGDWTAGADKTIDGATYHTAVSENGTATVYYSNGMSIQYTDPVPQVSVFGVGDQAGLKFVNAGINEFAGYSVAGVGDVDGDGLDDIVVGASGAQKSFLVFGRGNGFGEIDMDNFGSNGVTLSGGPLLSYSDQIQKLGDVNGDGYDDFIVARGDEDAYLIFGKASGWADMDLTNLGDNGIAITDLKYSDDRFQMAGVGDVNGDGYADFIIGGDVETNTDDATQQRGMTHLIFGKAGDWTDIDLNPAESDQVATLTGNTWDWAGRSVSSAGDVNGDGYADFIIGAARSTDNDGYPTYHVHTADRDGTAYLVLGDGGDWNDFYLSGNSRVIDIKGPYGEDQQAGSYVSSVGDVNGDGYDDVVVAQNDGRYLIFGAGDLADFRLDDSLGDRGVKMTYSGSDIRALGDINKDGYDDFLASDRYNDDGDTNAGAIYVVYGKAAGWENFDIRQIGDDGLEITGGFANEQLGAGAYAAGDFDGDGTPDILMGSPFNHEGGYQSGSAFLLRGGDYSDAIINVGSSSNDLVLGNYGADKLAGQQGNDTLIGMGGADILRGGQGNDVIGVSDLEFTLVDGGTGSDTLRLDGKEMALDFSGYAGTRLRGFERIDLGTGERNAGNSISANYDEVMDLLGRQLYGYNGTKLYVDGDSQDTVNIQGPWANIGTEGNYVRYALEGIEVRVDSDITVNVAGWDIPYAGATIDLNNLPGDVRYVQNAVAGNWNTVASAGDVNGDGYADLVFGYQNQESVSIRLTDDQGIVDTYSRTKGAAYLVFGNADGISGVDLANLTDANAGVQLSGGNWTDRTYNPASVNGLNAISGDTSQGEYAGSSVTALGDVNGDGLADILVGAYQYSDTVTPSAYWYDYYSRWNTSVSYSQEGRGYINFGSENWADGNLTDSDAIFTGNANARAGYMTAGAGDVNGDGYDDLLINNGRDVSLVFGKADGWTSGTIAGLGDQAVNLTVGYDREEYSSFSSAGDVNGDGYDDFIIGAPRMSGYDGGAYLVFGKADGWAPFSVAGADPDQAVRLLGTVTDARAGELVDSIGDINGDGYDDVLINASYQDTDANHTWSQDGAAYVVFGKADGWADMTLESLGDNGFKITGSGDFEHAGKYITGLGDVNADGFDDFIISSNHDYREADEGGGLYLIFGRADGWDDIDLAHMNEDGIQLIGGSSYLEPEGIGDVDGDGFNDILVGHDILYGGDFLDTATGHADAAGGSLAGTAGADRLVGNSGNDILTGGGGADVLYGGAGDDSILVADSGFFRIDGGSGEDALKIDADLDLTATANNRVENIEAIDLSGAENNTLTLALSDVLDTTDSRNTLVIDGDAGDAVVVADGTWTDAGVADGYHSYALGSATLLLDVDMTATITI